MTNANLVRIRATRVCTIAVLLFSVTACEPEPKVNITSFGTVESVAAVPVSQGIGLAVELDNPANVPITLAWDVTEGEVITPPLPDARAGTFQAPDAPGTVTITVTVSMAGSGAPLDAASLRIEVVPAVVIAEMTSTLTPPTASATPTQPRPTPRETLTEQVRCPYQRQTDAQTIVVIINAEGNAVESEDITVIQTIFAKDAIIQDAVSGEEWHDPVARYAALFSNTDFIETVHFEIQPAGPGIGENVAYFTSGSTGRFISVDQPNVTHEYDNRATSDHWTFGRNSDGCWVITAFTFNASHIQFPP